MPAIYLNNEVIAHRHMRALVLQDFFFSFTRGAKSSNLFETWGKVGAYVNSGGSNRLQTYLSANRATIISRCRLVTHPKFHDLLCRWLDDLLDEVQSVIAGSKANDTLF